MSIEKKCTNCVMYNNDYQNEYCYVCENETDNYEDFIPKEELIRQDEREKMKVELDKEIHRLIDVEDLWDDHAWILAKGIFDYFNMPFDL